MHKRVLVEIPAEMDGDVEIVVKIRADSAHELNPPGYVVMRHLAHDTPETRPAPTVVGQIRPAKSTILLDVEAYTSYLRGRALKPRSIDRFVSTLEAGIEHMRLDHASEMSFERVTEYLGGKVSTGAWSANTMNSALSVFRGFAEWCHATKRIAENPLILAHNVPPDESLGCRAATTEEARRLLAITWETQKDRRSKGNRALYFYCCFMAGLRFGELGGDEKTERPRGWKWADLQLNRAVPLIVWKPDMHKGSRHCALPLRESVAELLRQHRETVPNRATDPVFPVVATRAVFRDDLARSGIQVEDERGRRFSTHSCRKWFKTELVTAGVQADLINALMRHAPSVGDRYLDATEETYKKALDSLPEIWPEKIFCKNESKGLISTPSSDDNVQATPEYFLHTNTKTSAISGGVDPVGNEPVSQSASHADSAPPDLASGDGFITEVSKLTRKLESANRINPQMPRGGLKSVADSNKHKAVAKLLRALAGLLE